MKDLKSFIGRGKRIGKNTITRGGENREVFSFKLTPSLVHRFEKEIYRRKMEGEKITKGKALEEAIELWLKEKGREV